MKPQIGPTRAYLTEQLKEAEADLVQIKTEGLDRFGLTPEVWEAALEEKQAEVTYLRAKLLQLKAAV